MKAFDDIELSFHVSKQEIKNMKYFILDNQKYPIDFDLLKKNCNYFYRNRRQFKFIDEINILNNSYESSLNISEETIQVFILSCRNEPCQIHLSNLIPLQYLSFKFEFTQLIKITEQFIEEHSNELIFHSILFKLKLQQKDDRNTEDEENNEELTSLFFDTRKEEEIIATHLEKFIENDEMLLLPISVLDRIFNKYTNKNKNIEANRFIDFFFRCLDKYGKSASILFSYFDFKEMRIEVMTRLIDNYSDRFDFNMINSTLVKTTTDLTSEMAKQKEEYSFLLNSIKEQFVKNENQLEQIMKEKVEMKTQFEEREKIFEEQCESMKKQEEEIEKQICRLKEEEEKSKQREKLFYEQMKKEEEKLNQREKLFQEQMKKEEEKSNQREKLFMKQMRIEKENLDQREKLFMKQMRIEKENLDQREKLFHEQMKKEEENLDQREKQFLEKMEIITKKEKRMKEIEKSSNDEKQMAKKRDFKKPLTIIISVPSVKKVLLFDVYQEYSIQYLKEMIEAKEGIPTYLQCLFYGIKQLENDKTIIDYDIQNDSKIELIYHMKSILYFDKIIIEKSNGEQIEIDCNPLDSIKEIKGKVQKKEKIPVEDQRLFYNGIELEDNQILERIIKNGKIIIQLSRIL